MIEPSVPKYVQLKKEIQSWIYSGRIKSHEQLPSEHELSRTFSISRQTVRQAIGEMVQEGLLYRIQGKGTYCAGIMHRSTNDTPTIGVLTTYISDYIFPLIVRGAEATLRSKGYQLLLASTDNDKDKERESLEMMLAQSVSGLIIEPTKSAVGNPNESYYRALEAQGIPYIMINERYAELNCPCIKVDDELGVYQAVEYLILGGHRHIAGFFKTDDLQGVNRMNGFIAAHRHYQLPFDDNDIVSYNTEEKSFKPLNMATTMLSRANRPTAFVCYNDELAIKMLDIIREASLQVPDDLSIIGFDDSFLATATEVKLTTIVHPKIELGVKAAELLIDIKERKIDFHSGGIMKYEPELIIRESTKKLS
ncbi:MAG: GntR family transcriptional regulator [Paenibacillaceae bacterium]